VEALTGGLFAGCVLIAPTLLTLFVWWVIMGILVLIVVYDVRHLVIPDELTVVLVGAVGLLLTLGFIGGTETITSLTYAGVGMVGAIIFFFALWYVSRGRWLGFGDVKLVAPLALLVGGAGVFSLIVLSFWIGALVSVALLLGKKAQDRLRGQLGLPFYAAPLTMKSAVPFAPFLVAAALVVVFTRFDVLTLFTFTR
jgi:leader peptidase (prepilin peptidase)/N-methyltransferase